MSEEPIGLGLAHETFLRSAARVPDRPALEVAGQTLSYAALRQRALRMAAALVTYGGEGPKLCATLVDRSASGYAAILATLCAGLGYVPMLPSLPSARIVLMLQRSAARSLIVDRSGEAHLDEILHAISEPMLVLLPDSVVDEARRARHPDHCLLGALEIDAAPEVEVQAVDDDDLAYLLFTSGSTGEPKGVMVAHRNVLRFLSIVIERYELCERDRFSHLFEITFDLSVFDLFAAWAVGGCVCVPDSRQRMLPNRYVGDAELSVWFSVPSAALLLAQMRALAPGVFPNLRLVLFCGEALPASLAETFAAAAPNAVVENIYGPTELTLACTHYRWHQGSLAECENEVVPIGEPFAGMRAKVVDEQLHEVAPGETGELLMTGPQRALGYWNDPAKTAAAFMVPPGETELFYRTGDRVRRPLASAPMTFLGRIDSQIKIHGHRVELGEIEAVLAREAGLATAVAIGWPPAPGGAAGVIAFVAKPADADIDVDAVLERMQAHLPRYMVPRDIRVLPSLPLNPNGKIDRKALRAILAAEADD